jgi:hypothetical protein
VSQHPRQEVNWEFLLASSKSTLQAYEQSRLNFATNVRKEIEQLIQVWVDESSSALLARWLIERNLAAEANAICANATSASTGSSEPVDERAETPCTPSSSGVPKPPRRIAPRIAARTHDESDKTFAENSIATTRFSATS